MCATCGCGDDGAIITLAGTRATPRSQTTTTARSHITSDGHIHTETVSLEQKVLAEERLLAEQNRQWLAERGDPRAQRHQLTGRGQDDAARAHHPRTRPTAPGRRDRRRPGDACSTPTGSATAGRARSRSTPARAATSTPTWCDRALHALDPDSGSLLFIENVGNLVCPALFDLGEHSKVVVISVTEGADKPLKYPHMFAAAGLVIDQQGRPAAVRGLRSRRLCAATPAQSTPASISCRCPRPRARVSRHGTTGSLRRQPHPANDAMSLDSVDKTNSPE